jgi:hypothetical protein
VFRLGVIIGLLVCGLLAGAARADTFKLTNGQEVTGDVLPASANEQGVQVKTGDTEFQKLKWADFSQEDLKKLAKTPKLEPLVEPFIEITPEERIKKTEVPNLKPVTRLERPAAQSLIGALFSSGLGFFVVLLLYGANVYAGYEVAIYRARPVGLVCGVAALLPVAGPILFLSLPSPVLPAAQTVEEPAEGAPEAPVEGAPGAEPSDVVNPMLAEGVEHPAGLKLAHSDTEHKPKVPPTVTFQRGQFTFNRRFIETKFPGFFSVVRREDVKDMVLVIKSARGEYIGQRISRIAANDLHLEVHRGSASEEIMIPFQEIQQIQLKHKDAP